MFEEQKKSAVDKVKWVWWFLKEELPQFLSNWTMTWFMALEAPNNAQAGFVSVVVGAGAAWFGLYVNGKSSKIQK